MKGRNRPGVILVAVIVGLSSISARQQKKTDDEAAVKQLGRSERPGLASADQLAEAHHEPSPEAARAALERGEPIAPRRRQAVELLPHHGEHAPDLLRGGRDAVARQHLGVEVRHRRTGDQGSGGVERDRPQPDQGRTSRHGAISRAPARDQAR